MQKYFNQGRNANSVIVLLMSRTTMQVQNENIKPRQCMFKHYKHINKCHWIITKKYYKLTIYNLPLKNKRLP